MKRSYLLINRLSGKQIKTYATIIIFSILSLEAFASGKDELRNSDPMKVSSRIILEKELSVEKWMMTPFKTAIEGELAVENWMNAPFETALDEELAVEEWMTTPFETAVNEEFPMINSYCIPAP